MNPGVDIMCADHHERGCQIPPGFKCNIDVLSLDETSVQLASGLAHRPALRAERAILRAEKLRDPY